jgi:formate dehydrogenase subunit gamma
MRYIQRHSAFARGLHWIHTIACLALFATGLILFIPAVAAAVGVGAVQGARILHRVMAVIFIVAPIASIIVSPKGFVHLWKSLFFKWDDDDKEFMVKFFPYLFFGAKQHMPPQRINKSGQGVADGALIFLSIPIAITGVIMWWPQYFGGGAVVAWSIMLHSGLMILIGVFMLAHIYLGAGVFQPYKGSGKLMFGNGRVSESDALYHWGTWAKEELRKGDNVIVE